MSDSYETQPQDLTVSFSDCSHSVSSLTKTWLGEGMTTRYTARQKNQDEPQIPTDVNEILSDENAELGLQTQAKSQAHPLVDSAPPTLSQYLPVSQVVEVDIAVDNAGGSCVIVEATAATANNSTESKILLVDSQIQQSPGVSVIGTPTNNAGGQQKKGNLGVPTSGVPPKAGVPPKESLYNNGHDDPEVITIDQECLDSFVSQQHDYPTMMNDHAVTVMASHLNSHSET